MVALRLKLCYEIANPRLLPPRGSTMKKGNCRLSLILAVVVAIAAIIQLYISICIPGPVNHDSSDIVEISGQHSSMSACLIIMDDNHFLVEWIAYHYLYLPLRRLIVAVDPKSQTSPSEILGRYSSRGLIDITIWNDTDYLDPSTMDNSLPPLYQHAIRQNAFIAACLRVLKEEKRNWVYVVDTDEFVFPNRHASEGSPIYKITHYKTLLGTLQHPGNQDMGKFMIKYPCFPIFRLDMLPTKESSPAEIQPLVPPGLPGARLLTFRYRWPDDPHRPNPMFWVKTMIDVSQVNETDIRAEEGNCHMVLKNVCGMNGRVDFDYSPFIIYHYHGTLEHIVYRRGKEIGTRFWNHFSALNATWKDDTPLFWLQKFVDELGAELAQKLLAGAGENVEGESQRGEWW